MHVTFPTDSLLCITHIRQLIYVQTCSPWTTVEYNCNNLQNVPLCLISLLTTFKFSFFLHFYGLKIIDLLSLILLLTKIKYFDILFILVYSDTVHSISKYMHSSQYFMEVVGCC